MNKEDEEIAAAFGKGIGKEIDFTKLDDKGNKRHEQTVRLLDILIRAITNGKDGLQKLRLETDVVMNMGPSKRIDVKI